MLSGYQDSNLGPPAPKAGALTGLRYIPNHVEPKPEFVSFRGAKIYTFFYYAKFFAQLFLFFCEISSSFELYLAHQRPVVGLYGRIHNVGCGGDIFGLGMCYAYVVNLDVGLVGREGVLLGAARKVE